MIWKKMKESEIDLETVMNTNELCYSSCQFHREEGLSHQSGGDFLHLYCIFSYFLFYIRVQLTNSVEIISSEQQSNLAIHMHVSILPQTPSHPATWHWAELPEQGPCRTLFIIHFKCSSGYRSISKSLTIPSLILPFWQP